MTNIDKKKQELDQFCYFCDFDKIVQKHHIIRKTDFGLDDDSNYISLCPNCHAILHKGEYVLQYMDGHYVMLNVKNKGDKIYPSVRQRQLARQMPSDSIIRAMNFGKLYYEKDITQDVLKSEGYKKMLESYGLS